MVALPLKYIFIVGWILILSATQVFAETYTITRVFDGDTVQIKTNNSTFKLRLADIDAPERNQAYGKKSRRALVQLCQGRAIVIHIKLLGLDQYHRHLGHLKCNQVDAGVHLIAQGLAWHNAKYSHNPVTQQVEFNARQKRIGLWKAKKPMPPWVWREKHRHN